MKKILTKKFVTIFLSILLVVIYLIPYRAYINAGVQYDERDYYSAYEGQEKDCEETKRIQYNSKWYDLKYSGVSILPQYGYSTFYDQYKDQDGNTFSFRRDTGELTKVHLNTPEQEPISSEFEIDAAKKYLISRVGPINALLYQTGPENNGTLYKTLGGVLALEQIRASYTAQGTVTSMQWLERGEFDFSIVTKFEVERAKQAFLRKLNSRSPSAVNHRIEKYQLIKTPDDGIILEASCISEYMDENGEITTYGAFLLPIMVEFRPKTIGMAIVTALILLLWMPSILASMFRRISTSKKKQSTE